MLEKLKQDDFDKVFYIMEQSFPEDEYRPYEEQKALLGNPLYHIFTLDQEEITVFAAVWEFENFLFLEHLATNPEFRNQGLGAKLLKELTGEFNKMVCLEVELPEEEMAIRRIKFYEQNGFCFNSYEYMQPAISKGKKPVPLRIMTSGKPVTEKEFRGIKDLLYKEVYKVMN